MALEVVAALIEADGQTVFATHGHLYNPMHLPPLKKGDGCSKRCNTDEGF